MTSTYFGDPVPTTVPNPTLQYYWHAPSNTWSGPKFKQPPATDSALALQALQQGLAVVAKTLELVESLQRKNAELETRVEAAERSADQSRKSFYYLERRYNELAQGAEDLAEVPELVDGQAEAQRTIENLKLHGAELIQVIEDQALCISELLETQAKLMDTGELVVGDLTLLRRSLNRRTMLASVRRWQALVAELTQEQETH